MAGSSPSLSDHARDFIDRQALFFVATAAPDGRVNVSPKGLDTLRVLAPDRLVWLSLSGSGNETAAHLLESDRMTLMFCAFDSKPGILRVYGHAKTYYPRDADWPELSSLFPTLAGTRQIYDLTIDLVTTSCGTGIPVLSFQRDRGTTELIPFYEDMGKAGVSAYWKKKNVLSIDGKPTGILDI